MAKGGLDIFIILGLVAIGGWCFLMGPCKGLLAGIGNPLEAGAITRPVVPGKAVGPCGPGEITTEAGCAKAVRAANYGGYYY